MPVQKLLPLASPKNENGASPPSLSSLGFNIKFPSEIQHKLINSQAKLKIIVQNGQILLKIDQDIFQLNQVQELSKVDLYKQFSSSTFKSIGSIQSRLTLSQPPTPSLQDHQLSVSSPNPNTQKSVSRTHTPVPSSNSSNNNNNNNNHTNNGNSHQRNRSNGSNTLIASGTKISLISKKLIHLLALGPINIDEMHSKTKIPKQDIESVLRSISMIYQPIGPQQKIIKSYPNGRSPGVNLQEDERYFVLNYSNYKELKLNDEHLMGVDIELLKRNCLSVFDHLQYPKNHPARLVMEGKKEQDVKPEIKIDPASVKPEVKPEVKQRPTEPKTMANPHTSVKRKRSVQQDDEYLQNLAERFKLKYKEYEELYKQLSISSMNQIKPGKPKSSKTNNGNNTKNDKNQQSSIDLKRLFEMHKDLEIWKKQLWNSVQQ